MDAPNGTQDLWGNKALDRQLLIRRIEDVYNQHGLMPMYTPSFEYAEVFNGHHGDGEALLFHLSDSMDEKYVLRYDATVPLARILCYHADEIQLPLKRYQIASSFRDDTVDRGHFREFTQCDVDIASAWDDSTVHHDVKIMEVIYDVLKDLGLHESCYLRLNHRESIAMFAERHGVNVLELQRVLDRVDKSTVDPIKIKLMHSKLSERGLPLALVDDYCKMTGLCLEASDLDQCLEFPEIKPLKPLLEVLPKHLKQITRVDLSLSRGADYYTGFIVEAIAKDQHLGAILGGGRYDNLTRAFGGQYRCAGFAFGLERVTLAMNRQL